MRNRNRMIIDLPKGGSDALISLIDGDLITKRTVSTDDLLASMAASYNFSTGIQPKGTRFFTGTPSKYLIGIETPALVRPFYVSSPARRNEEGDNYIPEKVMIPIPYCLFVFKIVNNELHSAWVFGLAGPVRSDEDPLYRFPFGNTFTDGRVCWGSVKRRAVKKPMETIMLISNFLDSTYNGDLFDNSTIKEDLLYNDLSKKYNGEKDYFWGLVKHLDGEDIFPISALFPMNLKVINIMRKENE